MTGRAPATQERLQRLVAGVPELSALDDRTWDQLLTLGPELLGRTTRTHVRLYVLPLHEVLAPRRPDQVTALLWLQSLLLVYCLAADDADDVADTHAPYERRARELSGRVRDAATAASVQLQLTRPSMSAPRDRLWLRASPLLDLVERSSFQPHDSSFVPRYRALLALSVLLDDLDDILEDVAAGAENVWAVTMRELQWHPLDWESGLLLHQRARKEVRALRTQVQAGREDTLSSIASALFSSPAA